MLCCVVLYCVAAALNALVEERATAVGDDVRVPSSASASTASKATPLKPQRYLKYSRTKAHEEALFLVTVALFSSHCCHCCCRP